MLELIRTAGIFMIITQTMYHFVSGSKYARYIRLLIRIMTLAVLIVPLLNLVKSGTKEDFSARLVQFEAEYETILKDVGYPDSGLMEEQIARTTEREIKRAADPALAAYGYEVRGVDAAGNRMVFTLCPAEGGGEADGVRPVREIRIWIGEGEKRGAEDGKRSEEEALACVLASCLGVEESWVEVRILE